MDSSDCKNNEATEIKDVRGTVLKSKSIRKRNKKKSNVTLTCFKPHEPDGAGGRDNAKQSVSSDSSKEQTTQSKSVRTKRKKSNAKLNTKSGVTDKLLNPFSTLDVTIGGKIKQKSSNLAENNNDSEKGRPVRDVGTTTINSPGEPEASGLELSSQYQQEDDNTVNTKDVEGVKPHPPFLRKTSSRRWFEIAQNKLLLSPEKEGADRSTPADGAEGLKIKGNDINLVS